MQHNRGRIFLTAIRRAMTTVAMTTDATTTFSTDYISVTDMSTYQPAVEAEPAYHKLVSDELRQKLEIVFYVAVNGVIGCLGCLANVINIIVFVKQGFKDSVNISLFGLAVSDLGSLVAIVWESVCLNPLFFDSGSAFSTVDIHYLTSAVPHGIFVRIAWWITTFITFERCLCIAMPLKVKQIITPRRTVYIIVVIFVLTFLGMSPLIMANRIGPVFVPALNRTQVVRIYRENGLFIENLGLMFNISFQFGSFIIDFICTAIIIQQLNVKSKWRNESAQISGSGAKEGLATRDRKVVKMVTLISVIFIACLMPSCVNFLLGIVLAPDYTIMGRQQNLFLVIWSTIFTLESINSSVNIFVYYNMSSKFKAVFDDLFCSLGCLLRFKKNRDK